MQIYLNNEDNQKTKRDAKKASVSRFHYRRVYYKYCLGSK